MPIRPDQRWFYPIDWRELSTKSRFNRAKSRCEECRRPHKQLVVHLGDGVWWDADIENWRDGSGRPLRRRPDHVIYRAHVTYVVLACAHLDHDPTNNDPGNLSALCQRCHMLHDAAEHRWRRWWNAFRRRAIGYLFYGDHAQNDGAAHRP